MPDVHNIKIIFEGDCYPCKKRVRAEMTQTPDAWRWGGRPDCCPECRGIVVMHEVWRMNLGHCPDCSKDYDLDNKPRCCEGPKLKEWIEEEERMRQEKRRGQESYRASYTPSRRTWSFPHYDPDPGRDGFYCPFSECNGNGVHHGPDCRTKIEQQSPPISRIKRY